MTDYRATILPEITKASINDKLVFVVAQSKGNSGSTESYSWSLQDAESGDNLSPDDGGSLTSSTISYTPSKRGVLRVSVTYSVSGDTYTGARTISINFPGLRFSSISEGDASSTSEHNQNNPPSGSQTPMNLAVLNLRAAIAPCVYWKGAIRNYLPLSDGGLVDAGRKTSVDAAARDDTGDWIVQAGWEVLSSDIPPFNANQVGTVARTSEFTTGCTLLQASAWHTPSGDAPYLRCNGAKPDSLTPVTGSTTSLGRCPYYSSDKKWKYVLDDKLGFIEKSDTTVPYISAQHIQELRLNSANWSNFENPYEEFEKRFPIDTIIWSWTGYVPDPESGALNLTLPVRIKMKSVSVDSDVKEVVVGPEIIVQPGSPVSGEEPDYPTLIKELTDTARAAIDFPLGGVDNPFIIRQFGSESHHTELYGHIVGQTNQVVYAVNIDYVIQQTIARGFGAIRPSDETDDPVNAYAGVLTHSDYIQFLLDFAPDLIFQTTTNEDGIFSFGMDWNNDSNTWTINRETQIPLLYEWQGSSGVSDPVQLKNRIKVFVPAITTASSGEMFTDKTYVVCRFLHALTYQKNFIGDCDNHDSAFQSFSADISVQLLTGYESIDRFIIASPDLSSLYATWRKSRLIGDSAKKESYFLEKNTATELVTRENIFPLYRNKDFFVKISSLEANRLSKFQITKATIGDSIELEVIDHTGDTAYQWLQSGLGSSYGNGSPMPANYVHLRMNIEDQVPRPIDISDPEFAITIEFSYLTHKQNGATEGLSPRDPTKTINVLLNPPYSLSFNTEDGLSYYSPDRLAPPYHSQVYSRDYRISGSDITDKIRYIVMLTDDEGRPIGKKESAVLFAVAVPSCGDHEIRYAWTGSYTGVTLGPRNLRFCDWGSCNNEWGYSCIGTPMHFSSGLRIGQYSISGNCFDHGLNLDRVWWPYNRCLVPTYQMPNYFAVITEYVDLEGRSPKYLAGYSYFYEGVDNTGFWDCSQGTYYRNFKPISNIGFEEIWGGFQVVRAGDLRGGGLSDVGFFGTKSGSQWLWGVDRERFVFYVGTEKSMNYADITTGYASLGTGVDNIDGQGFLSEQAGVDLNIAATEDYINPLNVLMSSQICGFPTQEQLLTEPITIEVPDSTEPIVIDYRQTGRYYITPSYISSENWGWPLIYWVYKNTPTTYTSNGESVTVYRGEFPDNTQTAWVYRDKISPDIVRTFTIPPDITSGEGNDNLTAIVLSYPPDEKTYSVVPDIFEDLEPIPSLTHSYRPDDGDYILDFKAPTYNVDGTLQQGQFAKLAIGPGSSALGPARSISPTGYFISKDGSSGPSVPAGTFSPEEPYTANMRIFDEDLIDKSITVDTVPVHVETGKIPTTPTTPDKLMQRILLVKQPVAYNSLPNKVDVIAGPTAAQEVVDIKTAYKYSSKPDFGPDSALTSLVRFPANVETSLLNADWTDQPMAAFQSYGSVIVEVRLVTGSHAPTEGKFLKDTHISSIEFGFLHGNYSISEAVTLNGDIPDVVIEARGINDSSYVVLGSKPGVKAPQTTGSGRFTKVTFDNIDYPVERLRFTFTKPANSSNSATSLMLVNCILRGRVLISKFEQITSYNLKYTISKMWKEDGTTGVNGSIDNVIPGLVHSNQDGRLSTTVGPDTYSGDVRREVTFSTNMMTRPSIPQPQGSFGDSFINSPEGAYASVFKAGRVAMGRARGDRELRSTTLRGLDLCSGNVPITAETFGGGGKGPLECAQEGAYKYAANFFTETKAKYTVWTHPHEVQFFEKTGIKKEFIPTSDEGLLIESTLEVQVPKELFLFRGDDSKNYIEDAGGFFSKGHFARQQSDGDCWCWVGRVYPLCGKFTAPCIDRYIVHEHGGGRQMYTNDFGAVLRRYYTLLNRALIIMSVSSLSANPELFGGAFPETGGVDPTRFWSAFPVPWTNASVSKTDAFEMGSGFVVWWPGGFMPI